MYNVNRLFFCFIEIPELVKRNGSVSYRTYWWKDIEKTVFNVPKQ